MRGEGDRPQKLDSNLTVLTDRGEILIRQWRIELHCSNEEIRALIDTRSEIAGEPKDHSAALLLLRRLEELLQHREQHHRLGLGHKDL